MIKSFLNHDVEAKNEKNHKNNNLSILFDDWDLEICNRDLPNTYETTENNPHESIKYGDKYYMDTIFDHHETNTIEGRKIN